jgi:MFS family permease
MQRVNRKLRESLAAFREVFRNPGLRRLQTAFATSELGDWGATLAVAVLAFNAGGAAGVGLLLLIRMLPAALAAPFTAILGDRYDRVTVMLSADLVRAAAMAGAAAAAFAGTGIEVQYAIASIVSVVSTAFRPAQAAVLPSLSRTPSELTAANVASSTIESVTSFAGPAIGGAVLAATEPGVTFVVASATYVLSAALLARIGRVETVPDEEQETNLRHVATAGFRAIGSDARVRVLVGLFAAQTLVAGALGVLVVVLALDVLATGETGLGALNAALGVGGVVGAVGAIALIGRRRLARAFTVGTALWGLPIALAAVWDTQAGALVLLGIVGLANTVVDVAGFTLLQRAVPDAVLARVFGVLESVFLGTVALGGVATAALVEGAGSDVALIVSGAFLPIVAVLAWRPLTRIDAAAPGPAPGIELLRAVPFFAPLPETTLERLAARLDRVTIPAGEAVVRQGEAGDLFYVIEQGEVDIEIDGEIVHQRGPGEFFGEIALLRDVPRTATVRARTDLLLMALERDEFLAAVTGHAPSAEAAGAIVAARLGVRPNLGPL